jgi:hypothetical protein
VFTRNVVKGLGSITIGDLQPGDCIELRTANSTYRFWVEFASESIGVVNGGNLVDPTRARLAAEHTVSGEAAAVPIRLGDRLMVRVLGPTGACMRRFVTSSVEAIALYPARRVAA